MNRLTNDLRFFLKSRLSADSGLYRFLRAIYARTIFKLQRSRYGKRREALGDQDGPFQDESELFMCSLFPKAILDYVLEELKPASVLDVGCGTGVSMAYFAGKGVEVKGLEGSEVAIRESRMKERIQQHNLLEPIDLPERFELSWCYEVAEHIPPEGAANLIQILTTHGERVVFSAAPPGQGGHGHVNEQPPEYWIAHFEKAGFALDDRTHRLQELALQRERVLLFQRRDTADGNPSSD